LFYIIPNNYKGENEVSTEEVGKNVNVSINENILTITIDLSKEFGLSGSGKSTIIATTSGNKGVGKGNVKLGLNCYTPVK
jgi:ABC-type lipoprotein export system ATPase subunit